MLVNVRSQALSAGLLAAGFAGVFMLVWWLGHMSPATEDFSGNTAASIQMTNPRLRGGSSPPLLVLQPVTGNWSGRISLGRQQSELRFNIGERNGQLSGTVHFPVGDGVIQTGARMHNQVSMTTLNRSPGTGQTLRTEFSGHYEGDVMRLVMTTETGADVLTLQRLR